MQVTEVGGTLSGNADITSDVIQGSCLGPLLFMSYINDIVTVFDDKTQCKLYADDLKPTRLLTQRQIFLRCKTGLTN